ncbi:Phosphoribosyl 1,2-cyclic phosphodiesterase [Natronincola peptidivorans]|uniref:Phosphoribosyl 1,2-cyclic phosphodiesterase n=1 Tax=Natronincola peptidivorans TaxID=426128 RepID=A0A1I0DQ77_9FIRM|nr:MBL fold metallo-hydrolase [Natronincola peptidivorans]SET34703.1 Phosphoribosyl 1,2-cyclic phosphodiesterase [Natronincola peptidivorans]
MGHTKDHMLEITFWGVRGSRPTPGPETTHYGGNTSCVHVRSTNHSIIFDGGTGLAALGQYMTEQQSHMSEKQESLKVDLFFSHQHWDHIQGLPFFKPLYQTGNIFHLYGETKDSISLERTIKMQMQPPHFPISIESIKSTLYFHSITGGQTIDLGYGLEITSFSLNHPNGALAYRLNLGDNAIVYCTDTEPLADSDAQQFLSFIQGVDVLIYDSHYTDDEYCGMVGGIPKTGWGHSTWQEGVRISQQAHVRSLVLFHHKEDRTDDELKSIEKLAQDLFRSTIVAREGVKIIVGGGSTEKVVIHYP